MEISSGRPEAGREQLGAPAGVIVDGHYAPPPRDSGGRQWVRTSALVLRPASDLYALWRDIARAPLWQEEVREVRITGPNTSHWVSVKGTGDEAEKAMEWDSEILNDEPGKRIAWRSIEGDVDSAGEVVFETAPNGRGTVVTVLLEFRMGAVASAWRAATARDPKQAVIENLRHFKALAEAGEIPRVQGQPHGPRGAVGRLKRSLYGETVATPAGAGRMAG